MATIKALLGIICTAFICSGWLPERNLLISENTPIQKNKREIIIDIARKELGVREKTGKNDGTRVELYLKYIGLGRGHAWCAAYLSWAYGEAGYTAPRSGWSPDLFPAKRLVKQLLPGNIFGIYFPALKRIAHVGLIEKRDGDWLIGLEGNTNVAGGREGDGVFRKRRHIKTISKVADWIGKEDVK